MKNIHLIPTDKPSRLFIDIDDNKLKICVPLGGEHMMNQNIYITNDEVIKEGEWCYDILRNIISKCIEIIPKDIKPNDYLVFEGNMGNPRDTYKKIILTNDTNLIKDGVQAIDDELLEWFVKHACCESVDVTNDYEEPLGDCYKIIIPKEKPNYMVKGGSDAVFPSSTIIEFNIKQETLKEDFESYELAETLFKEIYNYEPEIIKFNQQHEMIVASLQKGIVYGAEYQAKRMFSNDEVNEIIAESWNSCEDNEGETFTEARKRILEKFKKI